MAQNPWKPSYIARNGRLVLYLDTPLATSSGSASSGSRRQALHHRPRFDEEGDDDIRQAPGEDFDEVMIAWCAVNNHEYRADGVYNMNIHLHAAEPAAKGLID